MRSVCCGLLFCVLASSFASVAKRPLKVFILAGQSNMQGHANVSTIDSMADYPATAPLYHEMIGGGGRTVVCDKVWISSIGCGGNQYSDILVQSGKLTAGFGASQSEIGPEFSFGLTMEKALKEPILIIKTSWGGRSLMTDFRPPSAGPRVYNDELRQKWKGRGLDPDMEAEKNRADCGVFYRHMIDHIRKVLGDIGSVAPGYDPKQGFELAGFVWFQGFNDMVDDMAYPSPNQHDGYDEYSKLLSRLIRDVRKDLSAPKLPFVIGVMGIGGDLEGAKPPQSNFRSAEVAPSLLPEFKGNVRAVQTARFWDDDLDALQRKRERKQGDLTPEELNRLRGVSNAAYHYLGAAKILAPIGKAFADAVLSLNARRRRGKA